MHNETCPTFNFCCYNKISRPKKQTKEEKQFISAHNARLQFSIVGKSVSEFKADNSFISTVKSRDLEHTRPTDPELKKKKKDAEVPSQLCGSEYCHFGILE